MATSTEKQRSTRNGSKSRATGKVKCIFCSVNIDDDKPALRCDGCKNWVCLACSKLPKALYTEMVKCDPEDIDWHCRVCKTTKCDIKSIGVTLNELKLTSEARLSNVESRLTNIESTVKSTVLEEVKQVKESLAESINNNLAESIDKIVEARVKEIEDKKVRSQNIVVFKLKPLNSSLATERKQHDIDSMQKIFSAVCPDKGELNIRTCFRLVKKGNPIKDSTPLKVVLNSKDQRRHLLTNAKKISELEDPEWADLKNVIIVRDLTVEQRKANQRVQKEKEQREETGEDVQMRFGEVVNASPNSSFLG